MADDIFDQIINLADNTPRSEGRSTLYGAAAEIQRLRAENDWYKAVNTQLQAEIRRLQTQIETMRLYGNRLAIYAADQLFGVENTARTIKEALDKWSETNGS